MRNLEQLAVRVKVLQPTDSIAKAAEAVRCSAVGAVPVVQDGFLCGLVTAALLADYLDEGAPERTRELTVSTLALERALALPENLSPADALQFLRQNGLERAPVIDRVGGLVGIVSLAELVAGVCGRVPPPLVGGMATPFGVYLTGGGARGGVNDWALVTTGVYMFLVNMAAVLIAVWLTSPGGYAYPAALWLRQAHLPALEPVLTLALFGLLFRLSWITGYHAAEHQVVHAIEAGDDLRPEIVRRKPRVHPRCGTNLVTAVMLMIGFMRVVPSDWGLGPILPMLLTFFLWRRVGGVLQQYVTTRPASLTQLQSGISAGEQLIERYQQRGEHRISLPRRIWNIGILQVLSGYLVVLLCILLVSLFLPVPEVVRGLAFS